MRNNLFKTLIILTPILAACSLLPRAIDTAQEAAMPESRPLVIAHRGARSLAPENTLSAARKAFEVGADMWELDVAVTADKELIVIHDDTLTRTCNAEAVFPDRAPWQVWDFTLEEIQMLDCGSWFVETDPFGQIQAGNISQADLESYVGEQAPTLREALLFTRDNNWGVNVELKKQPTAELDKFIVEQAAALIEELGMDDGQQVVISSFDHDYLRAVRVLNGDIPVQAITKELIRNLPDYLAELGAETCNPKINTWSYDRMRELQAQGVAFNVWTVNDETTMQALINIGVHGIITDFPQTLLAMDGVEPPPDGD